MENKNNNTEEIKRVFGLKEWKNIPDITELNSNISSANEINKYYLDRIEEGRIVLEGNLPPNLLEKLKPNQSRVNPKIAKQQAEWAYGKLTEPFHVAQNIFKIEAFNSTTVDYSRQTESLINFHFNHSINKRHLIDQAAKSFYDNGVVIGKIGWDSETIEEEIITTEEIINDLGEKDYKVTRDKVSYLVENKPYITICDYDSITIDPSCRGDIDKANFVVHKYKTNKAALVKDGRYKNIDKIDLDKFNKDEFSSYGTVVQDGDNILDSMDFKDDSRKLFDMVEYWGMYDIYDNGILEPILICFVGDIVVRIEVSPMPDKKLPFVAASMLIEHGSIYGEPVSLLIKDEQQIVGNLARNINDSIVETMKKPKLIHPNLFSSVNEKNRYLKGLSATTSGQVHPAQGIYVDPTDRGFDREILGYMQTLKQEAQDATGNLPMTQSSGNKFNSANALNAFIDTVAVRESAQLGKFSQFWISVAKKFISMSYEFMEDEEIEFITGLPVVLPPNIPRTIPPYSLSVTVITMSERRDKSIFFMEILNRMGEYGDAQFNGVVLSKLAELNDSPDVAAMIMEIINRPPPEPTPEQIRAMELDFAEKESAVRMNNAQAEDYLATAQLKTSRISSEQAKTEYTYARADETNQRVIERDTGKDIARMQAESSIKLDKDMTAREHEQQIKTQAEVTNIFLRNLQNPKPNSLDPRKNI